MKKLLAAATGEDDCSDSHAEHRVGRRFRNCTVGGANNEQTRRVVRLWVLGIGAIKDRSSQYGI